MSTTRAMNSITSRLDSRPTDCAIENHLLSAVGRELIVVSNNQPLPYRKVGWNHDLRPAMVRFSMRYFSMSMGKAYPMVASLFILSKKWPLAGEVR